MNKKFQVVATLLGAMLFSTGCAFGGNTGDDSSISVEPGGKVVLNATEVKNVSLFIGDGMGPEQVKFGEMMKEEKLSFQEFPYSTTVDTNSLDELGNYTTTDSAAAATALATGVLTINGRVGIGPTTETPLETIMDVAQALGKSTGVITTEGLNGATPMGFASHAVSRSLERNLLEEAANNSGINFFASDATDDLNYFTKAGYSVIAGLDMYEDVKEDEKIFCNMMIKAGVDEENESYETFHETVNTALDFLSQDEDGFMLMAEGAHIDHGGHNNNIDYMVEELLAFDQGVQAALEWARGRTDTVVIVTADHETGDLHLRDGINKYNYRDMETENGFEYGTLYYYWGSTSHSDAHVGFYVNGKEIKFNRYSRFNDEGLIKNTDVFNILKDLLENKI